jgi:two-component system nitrate/nitrite sensor histidine kinase NarX
VAYEAAKNQAKDPVYRQARNLAAEEERNRLAQELHDNVAQTLGYLNLKAAAAISLLAEGQLAEAQANLGELKQLINETYTDVREEIFNLRAKVSSGLSFLETLDRYLAKYKRFYNLDIGLALEIEKSLLEFPTETGEQVLRIIQEALINVRKHAGVDRAQICFTREENHIRITVEDRGRGFEMSQVQRRGQSGFGLTIMQERAESIGGTVELDSNSGQGVRLNIWIPVSASLVNSSVLNECFIKRRR